MLSLDALLDRDLDYACAALKEELTSMRGRSLAITGGAGFLGYYLALVIVWWNERAGRNGQIKLTILDNFRRGRPQWLARLTNRATIVEFDLRSPLAKDLPEFDYVIHAAGIASPTYYRKYPIETMDANVVGLRNLLDRCVERSTAKSPVKGFLFFSSSEIYGDPPAEAIPTPETFRGNVSCTGPRACYDESKRYGETLCVNFAKTYDLPIAMARPFNNYGPGLKISDRRVIPDFAGSILKGEDVVLYSDGTPTRTYCYAADAIVGYYKVLVRGHAGEPYNIGIESPEISVTQLAQMMVTTSQRLFGYKGKVAFGKTDEPEYLVDNPNRRCPDIRKAREHLDYRPCIDIADGLERALTWYYHNPVGEDA